MRPLNFLVWFSIPVGQEKGLYNLDKSKGGLLIGYMMAGELPSDFPFLDNEIFLYRLKQICFCAWRTSRIYSTRKLEKVVKEQKISFNNLGVN